MYANDTAHLVWGGGRQEKRGGGEEENKVGFRLTCHFPKGDHYAASWRRVG